MSSTERQATAAPLRELAAQGQRIWIDSLSRQMLEQGELDRLIEEYGVVGVTSNPTIFEKAMADGHAYDDQLRASTAPDAKTAFLELAVTDIQSACDRLVDVWDGGVGLDGWVSMEVDPLLAHDADATLAEARELRASIDRDNLYVKIPATVEGLSAIEDAIADGIAVNVTLIFGLQRHREVAEAYIRGLERLIEGGGDPSRVASVASFFVSRVDTEADRRLRELGAEDLVGKLAIANAKLAYVTYEEVFAGDRWEALAARGATPQCCLWASTSTKDERYRDVMYVESLIGPDTVDTMPPETLEAFADHGVVERTLDRDVDEARAVLERAQAAGLDYDDLVETLEREGVEKFATSFRSLIEGIEAKRKELHGERGGGR
jgi:transaldolase